MLRHVRLVTAWVVVLGVVWGAGCAAKGRVGAAPATAGTRTGRVSASSDPISRQIDAVLSAIYGPRDPGITVIVVRDGRVRFRNAYGLASVELDVPMRPEMVLALASLTKQFTAAGILRLAEQGRLSLDDDITRFLPGYPTRGARITIEHLLTHTSGLSGLNETSDLRATSVPDAKVVDVIGDWVHDLPLDFTPGERWAYSNWGYTLLGAIIERASGLDYADYLRQSFFGPLGMTHTSYADRRPILPLRVPGYEEPADTPFNILPARGRSLHPSAAGGLLSTVDDLARWNEALDQARVLSAASLARMFTSFRLQDGTATNYGFGWDLGDYDGHRVQEHQGGTAGFLAHIVRLPDDRVFVAILSNRYSMSVPLQATAHRIAAIALEHPIAQITAVPVSAGTLEAVTGTYRGSDVGTCTVTLEGEGLLAQVAGLGKLRLVPVGPLTFRTPTLTWTFTFDLDAAGRGRRMRVKDWKLNDSADRVEPAPAAPKPAIVALTSADLDACAGEYESLNGILVKVSREADHLSVRPFFQAPVEVYPTSATEFATREGEVRYTFIKNSTGAVTGYLRSAADRPVPARRVGTGP